jgi:hypothetical protein
MKNAYEETINDLRIEIVNTKWWRFKKIYELAILIEHYEKLKNEA